MQARCSVYSGSHFGCKSSSDSRMGSLSFMTSTAVRFNDVTLQQIILIFQLRRPLPSYSGPLFSISISFGPILSLAWLNDLINNMQNDATVRSMAAPTAK